MKRLLITAMMGFASCSYAASALNGESVDTKHAEQALTDAQAEQAKTQKTIEKLAYAAQNKEIPVDERAKALKSLAHYPDQNALVSVARALKDQDPIIREAATFGAKPYEIKYRWRMVSPLLEDKFSKVRIGAAASLLPDYMSFTDEQKEAMKAPTAELLADLKGKTDNESKLLLADAYRWQQEWALAEPLYQDLVKTDKMNAKAWLGLSENLRGEGKDEEVVKVLDQAIDLMPENPELHYSKSLALVRVKNKEQASLEIRKAATMAKNNSYYWYLDGVMQEDFDKKEATKSYEKAYIISGAPDQLYSVCDIYARTNNPKTDECLTELKKYAPEAVIEELKKKQSSTK